MSGRELGRVRIRVRVRVRPRMRGRISDNLKIRQYSSADWAIL